MNVCKDTSYHRHLCFSLSLLLFLAHVVEKSQLWMTIGPVKLVLIYQINKVNKLRDEHNSNTLANCVNICMYYLPATGFRSEKKCSCFRSWLYGMGNYFRYCGKSWTFIIPRLNEEFELDYKRARNFPQTGTIVNDSKLSVASVSLPTWGAWNRLFSGLDAELLLRDWEIRHLYRSEWTRRGLYVLEISIW